MFLGNLSLVPGTKWSSGTRSLIRCAFVYVPRPFWSRSGDDFAFLYLVYRTIHFKSHHPRRESRNFPNLINFDNDNRPVIKRPYMVKRNLVEKKKLT